MEVPEGRGGKIPAVLPSSEELQQRGRSFGGGAAHMAPRVEVQALQSPGLSAPLQVKSFNPAE